MPNILWLFLIFSLSKLLSTKFILLWLMSKWINSVLLLQKNSPKATANSEGVLGFIGIFFGSFISSFTSSWLFFLSLLLSFFAPFSSKGGKKGFLLNFNFKEPKASSKAKLSKFLSGCLISELANSSYVGIITKSSPIQFHERSNILSSRQWFDIVVINFDEGLLWNQLWLRLRTSIWLQHSKRLHIDGRLSSWMLFLPKFNDIILHSREAFKLSHILIVFSSPIKFP